MCVQLHILWNYTQLTIHCIHCVLLHRRFQIIIHMKGFHKRGGAQWANLGGQTLQLKWLVNCKDPMHDCNRFLWQILHTTGEHWTDISKCIYWMLNPRRWTHQITKYWRWTIRHLYWSAQPGRHPVVKRQINLLHRLNNFFVTPIMTLNLTLLEMRKSQNTNAK